MLEIKYTNQFKKDVKLLSKQGKKLDKLYDIIDKISKEEVLPEKTEIIVFPAILEILWNVI